METVCVAWMGYNQVKIYLGVFRNEGEARSKFLAAGCVVHLSSHSEQSLIVVTDAFAAWLAKNVRDCPGLYSVSGNMVYESWNIEFDTVAFNEIVRGYDDD